MPKNDSATVKIPFTPIMIDISLRIPYLGI